MASSIQKNKPKNSIMMALLAAALYGMSTPLSKLLLVKMPPTLMASLLYLGAGIGMLLVNVIKLKFAKSNIEAKVTIKEMPFIISMVLLDIIAPIMLMIGLKMTTSADVALLNNFEIVATAVIALFIFKESIGKRMWLAIFLITLASITISVEDVSTFSFSLGSVFVMLATIAWGFENNCTRMLSIKDPLQVVVIKGFGSGFGSLFIVFLLKDFSYDVTYIMLTLLLGFVAYGLSIFFYIKAQRVLGAARTSAFYAAAPFIGVLTSWIFLRESISISFFLALFIMTVGSYFAVTESHEHTHVHKPLIHEHKHDHTDGHHFTSHHKDLRQGYIHKAHSHCHKHDSLEHTHEHTPDLHHTHSH